MAAGLLGLGAAAAAPAEEFSWEIAGALSQTELDPVFDTDTKSVAATYYFGGVDDSRGPYALASFLDPATRVSVTASHEEFSSHGIGYVAGSPPPTFDFVTETDDYSLAGRYVLPRTRWYFGGRYATGDVGTATGPSPANTDADEYGALAGKYFGDHTSLTLSYDSTKHRSESSLIGGCLPPQAGCPTVRPLVIRTTTETTAVDVLHVRRFRSLTYALSGRIASASAHLSIDAPAVVVPTPAVPVIGSITTIPSRPYNAGAIATEIDSGSNRVYSVGGELFPTPKIGVRLGYSTFSGEISADYAYDATATWFFLRNVGLVFSVSRQRAKSYAAYRDTDGAALRVIGRL